MSKCRVPCSQPDGPRVRVKPGLNHRAKVANRFVSLLVKYNAPFGFHQTETTRLLKPTLRKLTNGMKMIPNLPVEEPSVC